MVNGSERRKFQRYKTNIPALITSLVYDGYAYTLYKPFFVKLVDISRSGIRVYALNNSFILGCQFEIHFKIGNKVEEMVAEVVNETLKDNALSEYGCQISTRAKPTPRVVL